MTIYLDAVWILNFLLDFMLLFLTKGIARDPTKKWRLIIGAIIASSIVPITILFPNSFFQSVIGKLIFSIVIIVCSFQWKSIQQFMKLLLIFYFTTFAIGGGLIALHFLFAQSIMITNEGIVTFSGYGDPISWIFVVVGFPLVYLFTKNRMDKHAAEKVRYDQLYPVTIQLRGKSFSTIAYLDSGNQLHDPITRKPVIVCDEVFLKKWFNDEEWNLIKKANEQLNLEIIPKEWESFVQIVPYQGIQGHSLLLALRPEWLIVQNGDHVLKTNKFLIGIRFDELSKDRSYHCLLHPQIIKLAEIHSA